MIAGGHRPEAAVGVAIFGADARMHDVGAEPRNRKHTIVEQRLASRDDEVGLAAADERLGVGCIRRRDEHLRGVRPMWIARAQPLEFARFPPAVARRVPQAVMNAEREHVEEPPEADAADLPGHALPEPSGRFADDDRSANVENEPSQRARPSRSSAASSWQISRVRITSRCRDSRPAAAIRTPAGAPDR